jgi:ABC-type histidine transport system ATPase subunit
MSNLRTEKGKVFQQFAREVRDVVWSIHEHRTGHESEAELLVLYEGMIEAIKDRCEQQLRMIHHLQGKQVKPVVHSIRSIVSGEGGGRL